MCLGDIRFTNSNFFVFVGEFYPIDPIRVIGVVDAYVVADGRLREKGPAEAGRPQRTVNVVEVQLIFLNQG